MKCHHIDTKVWIIYSTVKPLTCFVSLIEGEKRYETSLHSCGLHGYLWQLV